MAYSDLHGRTAVLANLKAYLNLRYTVPERRAAFRAGLQALGYTVIESTTGAPEHGALFVTWNRIRAADRTARDFEKAGCKVIVAENASWGNEFAGDFWYHLALNHHNTAGNFPIGGPERWDNLGIELQPFRSGTETVILPQRGIGSKPVVMPPGWGNGLQGRVRRHPGKSGGVPLERDLRNCGKVITWGSGAAIKALMMGIPVESHMPNWIGEQDNTEQGRLAMFRRLAWANWRLSEIASGEAFRWLLSIPAATN